MCKVILYMQSKTKDTTIALQYNEGRTPFDYQSVLSSWDKEDLSPLTRFNQSLTQYLTI